jgi:hypothetical protein
MNTYFSRTLALLLTGLLILSACNLPNEASESPTAASDPSIEDIVELAATQTALAAMLPILTPTPEPPTAMVTPAETATETLTPEPTATPTVAVPMAEVGRETNCRVGPAGNYDLVATYQAGQMLEVVAKDLGGGFWFVRNPDKPEEQCYVLANNITISGDTSALPQFTPMASPTVAPFFKADFKNFDKCKGDDFARFTVVNTGSVPFRSAYIKVTDQKVNKSVEQALNAFDLTTGCIVAQNIAPLDPGVTGYVQTPPFKWEARGNKLRAVIMLCTEKDLKGVCITQTLEVKP